MGEQFGGYEIERRLGAGGMAEVFLAHRRGPEGFSKKLALKRVLPAFSRDREFVRLFVDEARLAAHLHHPHIVSVQDFGEVEGTWFMTMEFIDGVDLLTLLEGLGETATPFPSELALLLAADLASALSYAHDLVIDGQPAHVVHRDLSPSNVLLSVDGNVMLTDFGIAKAASNVHHTRTGVVKGKVPYMPPEQALGQKLDRRVDLFALGIVLYETLSGLRPYDGESELDTLQRISKGVHDPLPMRAPHAPPLLSEIVHKLIRPRAEERFSNAGEILDALAATPPPTNARRMLGNLVRQVKAKRESQTAAASAVPAIETRAPQGAVATAPAVQLAPSPAEDATRPKRRAAAPVEAQAPLVPHTNSSAPVSSTPLAQEFEEPAPFSPTPASSANTKLAVAILAIVATLAIVGTGAIAFVMMRAPEPPQVAAAGPTPAPPAVPVAPVVAPPATVPPAAPTNEPLAAQPPSVAIAPEEPSEPGLSAGADERSAAVEPAPAATAGPRDRARPEPRAAAAAEEPAAEARERGRIEVVALPMGRVSIDGHEHGLAPVRMPLSPGAHEVVVTNGSRREQRTVQIEAGSTERVVVRFAM